MSRVDSGLGTPRRVLILSSNVTGADVTAIRAEIDAHKAEAVDAYVARLRAAVEGMDPRGKAVREVLGGPDVVRRDDVLAAIEQARERLTNG